MTGTLYFCCDERRRATVRAAAAVSGLNGIDFLEVADAPVAGGEQRLLRIAFVVAPSAQLKLDVAAGEAVIEGGDRVRGIRALSTAFAGNELQVTVDRRGDFSTYTLRLRRDDGRTLPGMDPLLSAVDFSFKADCPATADCAPERRCPPEELEQPEIDYLAKDYASFRQLMLDRMALVLPEWTERSPADFGVALVEVLAYVGDHLSYQQDAVATEAYLGTARLRTSLRRHARLLDYPVHEGCNARAWVHLELRDPGVAPDAVVLPQSTRLLTRVDLDTPPAIEENTRTLDRALEARPEVFETLHAATLRHAHNAFRLHAWGQRECCLPRGATRATLLGHHPTLAAGDVLVFEEVRGPGTGHAADADPGHRHAVRLTAVDPFEAKAAPSDPDVPLTDPVLREATLAAPMALVDAAGVGLGTLPAGTVVEVLHPWAGVNAGGGNRRWTVVAAGGMEGSVTGPPASLTPQPLRITAIEWGGEDALPFALCLSAVTDVDHGARYIADVTVARGNIVLADHGQTVTEELPGPRAPDPRLVPAGAGDCGCGCDEAEAAALAPPSRYRPLLAEGPVTHAARITCPAGGPAGQVCHFDPGGSAESAFVFDRARVLPWIRLEGSGPPWGPRRDLLASGRFSRDFVVEVDDDGRARLRFGDDQMGERPADEQPLLATYRVGNGVRGNVGAGSIAHAVVAPGVLMQRLASVRNPLPGRGGEEPEASERIRVAAPAAFRTPERAVTPADYAMMAERHPEVQRAQATMRYTGSWRTVFLTVDRIGGRGVDADFEAALRRHLERYRMAGHDLEIDGPRFVPVEIHLFVCVDPGYFRGDVERALREVLGSRALPDGRRGIFHPDHFTFGQSVFLSQVYAAVQGVAGVSWAEVRRFRRQGIAATESLETGELVMGRLEVARLEDDPSFPERGTLKLEMGGGR